MTAWIGVNERACERLKIRAMPNKRAKLQCNNQCLANCRFNCWEIIFFERNPKKKTNELVLKQNEINTVGYDVIGENHMHGLAVGPEIISMVIFLLLLFFFTLSPCLYFLLTNVSNAHSFISEEICNSWLNRNALRMLYAIWQSCKL